MSENRNAPKLRFPGFNGDWNSSIAGTLFSISAGGDIRKENVSDQQTEDFPYPIFANAAQGKGLYGYSDVFKIEPPALTIAGRGVNVGISHVRSTRFFPIVRLLVLKPKRNDSANLRFFETAFNNLNIFLESTGVPQLTAPQISSYTLTYPSLPEQQKIADFLTAVDRRIELLQAKKEKLETYKKGVMQQIFSQKLRFKADDGSDFPDWEERKLGDLAKIVVGGTPSTTKKDYWGGAIGWIGSGELRDDFVSKPSKFITEAGHSNSSTFLMPPNTILLAMTGATLGKTGYLTFDCCGNQSVAGILPNNEFDGYFLFQTLQFEQNQILSLAGGAAQVGINKRNIESLLIGLPSLEEQRKIALFLRAVDKHNRLLNSEIEQTKIWKNGLLQKMFV